MEDFIVVIIGHTTNGAIVVKAWPHWEEPNMAQVVTAHCVDFANEFGTGDFTVEVQAINS